MRIKRCSPFKFVASFAVCGCLLGVSAVGAMADQQNQSQAPNAHHRNPMKLAAGRLPDKQTFLRSFEKSNTPYCESDCCWASGCDEVYCDESSCFAACGDETASYICAES
jgi:hypothetical protein